MLTLVYRIKHIPYSRIYSAASARLSQFSKSLSSIDLLEQDGARILRTVQKRVEERANLLAEISEDMSHPADVKRLRQIKELEPLKQAWDQWETNRQLLHETTPLLNDPDPTMRVLASEEYASLTSSLSYSLSTTFPSLLVPPSTTLHLSALLELKSGVGGSEDNEVEGGGDRKE